MLMVATRATIVGVLEVMMVRVIGVSKGPFNHRAFKAVKQLVRLIVEDPPSIRGILIELLILASHVGRGTLGLAGRVFQGVTNVVRWGILQGIVLCHTLNLLLVEH